MGEHDTENFFLYDCPVLEIKRTESEDPTKTCRHLYRYMQAITYAVDMPRDHRRKYLDYGCGSGYGTELVATYFEQSFGVDTDEKALDYAEKMHGRMDTVWAYPNILPQHLASFDFVTAIEVLEHMKKDDGLSLLGLFRSLLRRGGTLYLTTPIAKTADGSNPENPWHLHEWGVQELGAQLEHFFEEVHVLLNEFDGPSMVAECRRPKHVATSTS